MNTAPLTEEQMAGVNHGIRHTVQKLREWGFDTRDSGDGQTHDFACDKPFPYVAITVADEDDLCSEANRLAARLEAMGVDFNNRPHPQDDPEGWDRHPSIEASYSPIDGIAVIFLSNVIIPE